MRTILAGLLAGMILAGCSMQIPRDAGVDAVALGESELYVNVFDATREVLMDYRFAIDRVDARGGVITTHPKRSAGLATLWDKEQSSLAQEWEDLINEQRRVVRVEFDREEDGTAQARVSVEVLRTHRPNWRVQSESVRLSTHARYRSAEGKLEPGSYLEPVGLDTALAERLASAIDERLRGEAGGR